MALLFNKVDRPPAGAWRDDLHRAEPQSAFWHIGANTDATDVADGSTLGIAICRCSSSRATRRRRSGAPASRRTRERSTAAQLASAQARRRATAGSATSSRRTACCSS